MSSLLDFCVIQNPAKREFHTVEVDAMKSRSMLIPFKLIFRQVELNPDAATTPVPVQAFRTGKWDHKLYGNVEITPQTFNNMLDNFEKNVYGQDLSINFEHGIDATKGLQAAGWVRKVFKAGTDALSYSIEFTKEALQEIKDGKWRYFSPEYHSEWTDPETGMVYHDVLVGGALTNAPFFKGMPALNFSEYFTEKDEPQEFADWSDEYKKSLPDSAFMYVNGTTRMFPFKDSSGNVDKEHVQKIVQLAPRADVPQSVKDEVIARAKKLLSINVIPDDESGVKMTFREVLDKQREALKLKEVSGETDETLEIRIFSSIQGNVTELEPLRELRESLDQKKTFAERFPAEAQRMAELEASDREAKARTFSQRFARFTKTEGEGDAAKKVSTTLGFSALALTKIADTYKSFSEGTAKPEQFEEVITMIADGSGIVDFGNHGSSVDTENDDKPAEFSDRTTPQEARKLFHEKVKEVAARAENKEKTFAEHMTIAATENPKLAELWQQPVK